MRSYADMVLAATIPKLQSDSSVTSHLDYVLNSKIDETYFTGSYRWLWKASIDAALFNSGLDEDILRARMDEWKCPVEEQHKTIALYLDLRQLDIPRDKVKVILPQFKEEVHSERLADIIEQSARILTGGVNSDQGREEGYKDAKKHLIQRISALEDREQHTLPSQEIKEGIADFLQEYNSAKNADAEPGIKSGFDALDALTNGQQRGELFVMCGFTGAGKTAYMLNCAYNAAILQKKNVVFVSLEMPLHQVRRRLFVRHSNNTTFGVHGGLDYIRVKRGSLNIDEERALRDMTADLATGDYGTLDIFQMAKTETVESLRERITYARSRHPIDLVVLDYMSLLSPIRRRQNRQDEIIEIVEGLKSLCLNFNEGEGLAILTGNQTSRKAVEEAIEHGEYGINFASDTSAIEKNADLLAWLLRTDEMKANHEVMIGVPKYRDGDSGLKFTLYERYSTCLLDNINNSTLGTVL